ncbi:outer membrane protein [Phyllobacterium phragmitis]|uniref:Porin family protein n=1 Tax=Phyllobacterium phragmitis TaxID=2670329 RepID=A0ABQ0H2R6_9HYPH
MTSSKRILAAAAFGLISASPALAADLDPVYAQPEPGPVVIEPAPAEVTSGWYLRGDIGHSFDSETEGHYRVLDSGSYFERDYDSIELRGNTDFSIGAGYRFNRYLRADATLAYWNRDVFGSTAFSDVLFFDDTSKISAWELMANAYVDIATWGKITPYIGGGLGFTRVKYGTLKNRAFCYEPSICGNSYEADHGGLSSTRFTWALMAGATVDITANTKLDIGYRYSHIKGGKAFGWDAFDQAAGATGPQGYDDGFDVHQVRVGLRYEFGGPQSAMYQEPMPVYDQGPAPVYK